MALDVYWACDDRSYECAGRRRLSIGTPSTKERMANEIKNCAIYQQRVKTEKIKEVVKAEDYVMLCCFSF